MTVLALIPVFTFTYLRLFFFPWVLPSALLAELTVFLLLDPPGLTPPRLGLTVVLANLAGLIVGFILAFLAEAFLYLLLGSEIMAWQYYLVDLGIMLAIFVSGVVKCLVWSYHFGANVYLRRVVIVTHLLFALIIFLQFLMLPYFSILRLPKL